MMAAELPPGDTLYSFPAAFPPLRRPLGAWRKCVSIQLRRYSLRRHEPVAPLHQFLDFLPIDFSLYLQADPTVLAHVRRHVEALVFQQLFLLGESRLDRD